MVVSYLIVGAGEEGKDKAEKEEENEKEKEEETEEEEEEEVAAIDSHRFTWRCGSDRDK